MKSTCRTVPLGGGAETLPLGGGVATTPVLPVPERRTRYAAGVALPATVSEPVDIPEVVGIN